MTRQESWSIDIIIRRLAVLGISEAYQAGRHLRSIKDRSATVIQRAFKGYRHKLAQSRLDYLR